jgi:hypothetical protein
MGMYSRFIRQDIIHIDMSKISALDFNELQKDLAPIIKDNGDVCFYEWDNIKLEGYWLDDAISKLKRIAKHLDHDVRFTVTYHYEGGYHFMIIFEGGKMYSTKEKVQPIIWEQPILRC